MKQLYILALGAALLSLMACSDSDDDKSPQPAATASAPQTQQTQQPATKLNPAQQQAIDDAKGMPKQGVVKQCCTLQVIHTWMWTLAMISPCGSPPP